MAQLASAVSDPLGQVAHDQRGAVFVEKLIVYLPLMFTFFATWELAEVCAARIVVERACSAAGRAAVVVLPDDPAYYDDEPVHSSGGRRQEDIEIAAGMVLSAIPRLNADFVVEVSEPPETFGTIEVSVTAPYDCGSVSILCGEDSSIELSASSLHAYQGARYTYTTPSSLGDGAAALVTTGGGLRARGKNGEGSSNGAGPSNSGDCGGNKRFDVCSDTLSGADKDLIKPPKSPWPSQIKPDTYGGSGSTSDEALDYRCEKGISPDKNVAVIRYECNEGSGSVVAASGKDEAVNDTDWDHSEPNVHKKYKAETKGKTGCRITEYYTEREPCGGNDSCQTWFSNDGHWKTDNPPNKPNDPDGPGQFTPNKPGNLTWHFEHNYYGLDPEDCNYSSPQPGCPQKILDMGQACKRIHENKKQTKLPVTGSCETIQNKANKGNIPPQFEADVKECLRYKNIIDFIKKDREQGPRSAKSRQAITDAMTKRCADKIPDPKGKGKGKGKGP